MKHDIIEELFAKYYNEALVYTLSLCHSKDIAEDIVSMAFFKALSCADDSIRNFKPWLLTVCRNEFLSLCRKYKKSSFDELNDEIADDSAELIEGIIKKEEYRALYHAISLLPDVQREIVILFYFSDVPIKSIAQVIGKSETNTKVLMHRARRKLKQILEV
ncbi:MAG: RNA polymerase sigma factor [Porcipelethomonas sp.]